MSKSTCPSGEMEVNLYEYLGITSSATQKEIERAYRKKALKCHPDKNTGHDSTASFLQLCEVYKTLSNPKMRKKHDDTLEERQATRRNQSKMPNCSKSQDNSSSSKRQKLN